ncbi:uncharacterized protein [Choristoneura fumiferana]|uniref:uncharacterized protein n=1 Tax=Choristoneura fumiferana TaxID=7141 RepID=UPI003D157A6F
MIHNNDVSNTEDNGNKPRTEGDRDVTVSNEKFLFREPVVLISIVCLSLFSALSFYQQSKSIMRMPMYIQFRIYSLSTSAVPVIGLMFAAFLSEVTGRKHVYRYLFALSIFLAILVVSSNHPTVTCVVFILRGMIRGGILVMNGVAITEYSSPKHRFAWLICDKAAYSIISRLMTTITLDSEILFYILLVIQLVLGLICLGSTWAWPESPYWLANKGKLEQSRTAFMWLRGKGGREELASVLKARRRPGPPKLFWISLLIAIATILVSTFSQLQVVLSSIIYRRLTSETRESQVYIHLFGTTAITCTLAAVSYFVRRKVIFIVVSILSFILCYAEALCMYLISGSAIDSISFYLLHIASDVIQTSGPAAFGVILFIEVTPHKYNTFISCICFIVTFSAFEILFPLTLYVINEVLHFSVSIALSTTFALVAALLYYFFAPETKDKTLLEIQRSYTPDENNSNPEQNQSIMLNVI